MSHNSNHLMQQQQHKKNYQRNCTMNRWELNKLLLISLPSKVAIIIKVRLCHMIYSIDVVLHDSCMYQNIYFIINKKSIHSNQFIKDFFILVDLCSHWKCESITRKDGWIQDMIKWPTDVCENKKRIWMGIPIHQSKPIVAFEHN